MQHEYMCEHICYLTYVILIGMPGAGRSTVDVVLAKHPGMRFADSDPVIQE